MTASLYPARWPAKEAGVLQLYSLATPNGQKIGVVLEELELAYEAHRIDIMKDDQFDEDYKKINPNSKIPSIIDPNGPDGKPIALMESGAILMYLAEKTGKLMPEDAHGRWEAVQWLFFQMASVGPMFGQFGHFYKFAADKTNDTYAVEHYSNEVSRLLAVVNDRLAEREYLAGSEYSIADIATFPWINALDFYDGKAEVGYEKFTHVHAWLDRCMQRPAVQRGIKVCSF